MPVLTIQLNKTKHQNYITGDDDASVAYNYSPNFYIIAQTFTPSVTHVITGLKLLLYRVNGPGTVTAVIKATDGSGHPTGTTLASGTTDGDTLTTNTAGEWREITLSSTAILNASTKYAIVVSVSTNFPNYLYWRYDKDDATYAGGNKENSDDNGATWISDAGSDFMFEEYCQGDGIDSSLYQELPNVSFGSIAYLSIRSLDNPPSYNTRSIIQFDFSSLPTGAIISAATLNLYFYNKGSATLIGRTYWAYELTTTDWVELETTWNIAHTGGNWDAPGGDYTTTNGASLPGTDTYGWWGWNVLTLVQHFQSSHSEIANFLLRDGAEDDAKAPAPDFYSNNYSDDITLCPKLIITYTVPITGVKTVNEVAIASVKTINDVLVENIKSVNNIT